MAVLAVGVAGGLLLRCGERSNRLLHSFRIYDDTACDKNCSPHRPTACLAHTVWAGLYGVHLSQVHANRQQRR